MMVLIIKWIYVFNNNIFSPKKKKKDLDRKKNLLKN